MRVLLLLGDQKNQQALAAKIETKFELAGIVFEKRNTKPSKNIAYLFSKIADRLIFFSIKKSWGAMLAYYNNKELKNKSIPIITTDSINSTSSINFVKAHEHDIIVVSGTSLLKNELLQCKPKKGIINLHTGLSPYVKGGPNCTNWCIANNTIYLVGNTVMWIDKGIDSGNIIVSEVTPFTGNESLSEIHIKVMEHAHTLVLRALTVIQDDFENCPSVKQNSIADGKLFLTRMWNFKAKINFLRRQLNNNFKKTIKSQKFTDPKKEIITVSLPEKSKYSLKP